MPFVKMPSLENEYYLYVLADLAAKRKRRGGFSYASLG
jgi:hypothetical protein